MLLLRCVDRISVCLAPPPAADADAGEPEAEQRERGGLWDDILRGQPQVVQRLAARIITSGPYSLKYY
jgi:hypothetical protein